MFKVFILFLSLLAVDTKTVCMNHPDAVREYNRLAQIGTRTLNSNGEEAILTTQSDLNNICAQGRALTLPLNVAIYLASYGVGKYIVEPGVCGGLVPVILTGYILNQGIEFMVSRHEYIDALENDGPIAAAFTNQYGDGCTIL